jgi:hypothetical protein
VQTALPRASLQNSLDQTRDRLKARRAVIDGVPKRFDQYAAILMFGADLEPFRFS